MVGKASDTPILQLDAGPVFLGVVDGGRAQFTLPDTANGGATVSWADQSVRVIAPPMPGAYEADLPPVRPPEATSEIVLVYTFAGAITVAGDRFLARGSEWKVRGATDFRLIDLFVNDRGQFDALTDQRATAGANACRVLCMKANNTGWAFQLFDRGDWRGDLVAFSAAMAARRLRPLITVFADTRALMADAGTQLARWAEIVDLAPQLNGSLLQLCNEWNHQTQAIDPGRFARPTNGVLACHGSGLTDAPPASPRWDFACYHARRDGLPDARGITNYCSYGFEGRYPQPQPLVPAEGLKPGDYGFDPAVAALMGAHAGLAAGGFFHTDEGVNGGLWNDPIRACAEAFYEAIR